MQGSRVLRELPWGLACFVALMAMAAFSWWAKSQAAPSAAPPPPGQTLVGEAAMPLHPKTPAAARRGR